MATRVPNLCHTPSLDAHILSNFGHQPNGTTVMFMHSTLCGFLEHQGVATPKALDTKNKQQINNTLLACGTSHNSDSQPWLYARISWGGFKTPEARVLPQTP